MLKKNIGEILIDLGKITKEQLVQAETESVSQNVELKDYLVSKALITDVDLARAYATKFEVPFIDKITEKMADPDLLSRVSLKFLRENTIIPILIDDQITLVTSNPFDFQPIDNLNLMLGFTNLAIATRATIIDAINRYYPLEGTKEAIQELAEEKMEEGIDLTSIKEEDILGMETEAPIIKLVNYILFQAVKRGASDIHIEPYEKEVHVRYRIDGILYLVMTPPKRAQSALTSRLKIMANLNIAEKRVPQDGRINIKVADKAIDIRVSVLPVTWGERIVMRLLDKTKTFGKLKDLGFSDRDYKIVEQAIAAPNGILLVTGPTGSGKTSTLYSILTALNTPDVNIITVEDPVEYQVMGIAQVQVKEQIGLTFAASLRSILRQDPDIVMIGETRDAETAQIAIQAALTGHLVLSTLHTNSAAATVTRLIDMGVEPFLIASSLIAVIAQRLVRKLCPDCKQPYKPTKEVLHRLGLSEQEAAKITFYKAVGCENCLNTGYRGRLAVFEVMVMTNDIAKLTVERADTNVIQAQAIKDGMTLLIQDGVRKIAEGLTTVEEVLTVATSQEVLGSEGI